jgi:hypothetical protein
MSFLEQILEVNKARDKNKVRIVVDVLKDHMKRQTKIILKAL